MLVGCVSFDCHPGSPFFSHRRRMLLSLLCLLLPTPLALSPQKATPVPTTTLALSLSPQKVTRLICVLRCPRRPVPFATACLYSESRHCSRPAERVCVTAKGARADVDRAILCTVAAAVTPPPNLLLGCTRLIESSRQGGN
jgi:hypothetical protein